MAAPGRRALLTVAKGWRRFEGFWGSSLGSRSLTLAAAPSNSGSPWRLLGALCLQRPPVISKPLTPLQEEMAALLHQVDRRCGWRPRGAIREPTHGGTWAWVRSRLWHQLVCVTLDKLLHLSELLYPFPATWYLPFWVGLVHSRLSVKDGLFSVTFIVTLGKSPETLFFHSTLVGIGGEQDRVRLYHG